MKRFQHILVHLTLRDEDQTVLRWLDQIVTLAGTTRVTLLHSWQPVAIPPPLRQQYPWLIEPGENIIQARMLELVAKHLALPDRVEVKLILKEGNPVGELLDELSRNGADLVIINRDTDDYAVAEKLARKAPCSVLGVPADAPVRFVHVLAACDFSEFSRHALDVAAAFATASAAKLSLVHAFEVPWGHHRALVPREQIADDIKTYLTDELNREALRLAPRAGKIDQYLVESPLPSAGIARTVEEQHCDFVVIGCRGHGAIYATLLGSTAETILQHCAVPVLAVKQKGSSLPLLEQLRELTH